MKKASALSLAVFLTFAFTACTPATGIKSGAAAGEALIKLLPRTTMGVMAVDVTRAMGTEMAVKALQDPKSRQQYDEFVAMTGIDPMKDISYFGFGIVGTASGPETKSDGGFIVNLKYDKARLLGLLKEKAPSFKEETYSGLAIYSNLDGAEAKQTTQAAFLDASHIVVGSAAGVRGIIDVHQKKAESLAKNAEMAAVLAKADKSGFAWGAFAVPQELLKKGIDSTPQLKVLEGVTGLTLAFDYKLAKFTVDIKTIGGTREQNDKLASTLNGFKALGGMVASQEPAAGEALEAIDIRSGEDYTQLYISLSQELMDKLGKLAQAKAGDFMKMKRDEPAEPVK